MSNDAVYTEVILLKLKDDTAAAMDAALGRFHAAAAAARSTVDGLALQFAAVGNAGAASFNTSWAAAFTSWKQGMAQVVAQQQAALQTMAAQTAAMPAPGGGGGGAPTGGGGGGIGSAIAGVAGGMGSAWLARAAFEKLQEGIEGIKEFDQELAHMSTLLGDSSTSAERFAEQMESAGKTAIRVATEFNLTTTDVIKGMKEMLSSGVDASQLDDFSDKVGALARATQGNFEHIATMMTSVRDAYGLTVSQMGHVSDVIFNTINVGKVKNVEELTTNLGRLLPIAAAAGMSFETMMTGIAGIGRAGTTTGQAVTELGDIIKTLQNPSDKMAAKMHELGIETGQAAFAGKDMTQVLKSLVDATSGDLDVLNKLFPDIRGKRGIDALVLIQHALGGIEKGIHDTGTTAVAAQRDLDTFWDHLGQRAEEAKGSFKELGRTLAQGLDKLIFGEADATAPKPEGKGGHKLSSIDPLDDENVTAGFKHAFEYGLGLKKWMLAGMGSAESKQGWADMVKAMNPDVNAGGNKTFKDAIDSANADMTQIIAQAEKASGAIRGIVEMQETAESKRRHHAAELAEKNDTANRSTKDQKDKLASLDLEEDHEALLADTEARAANAALVKRQAEYNAELAKQVKAVHDAAPEDLSAQLVKLQVLKKEMEERIAIDKKFYGDQNAELHEMRIASIQEEKEELEKLIKTQMTQNELKESDVRAKKRRSNDDLRQDLQREMGVELVKAYDEDEKNYEKFQAAKLTATQKINAEIAKETEKIGGIQLSLAERMFTHNMAHAGHGGKDPARQARFAQDALEEQEGKINSAIKGKALTEQDFARMIDEYRKTGDARSGALGKSGDGDRADRETRERDAVEQGMIAAFQKMAADRGASEIAGVKGKVFKHKSQAEMNKEAAQRVEEKHVEQVVNQTITINAQGITARQLQDQINDSVTTVLSNIKRRGTGVTGSPTTSRGGPVGRTGFSGDDPNDE